MPKSRLEWRVDRTRPITLAALTQRLYAAERGGGVTHLTDRRIEWLIRQAQERAVPPETVGQMAARCGVTPRWLRKLLQRWRRSARESIGQSADPAGRRRWQRRCSWRRPARQRSQFPCGAPESTTRGAADGTCLVSSGGYHVLKYPYSTHAGDEPWSGAHGRTRLARWRRAGRALQREGQALSEGVGWRPTRPSGPRSRRRGSNSRPADYKSAALPTELRRRTRTDSVPGS